MMNISSPLAFAAAIAIGLFVTGCGAGLVPFTHELREQNRLTDDELKNLQFYVSHKITLRRELESGGRQVTGSHKLLLTSGKSIEEVIVEDRTPGIAVGVKGVVVSISFEPGSALDFVVEGGRPSASSASAPTAAAGGPNPFPGNGGGSAPQATGPELVPTRTAPMPDSFSGNYWLWVEPSAQLTFQRKVFDVVDDSSQAHLLIDADTLKEVVRNRKVLPGIRLPSR
jgi:hypothetical protein